MSMTSTKPNLLSALLFPLVSLMLPATSQEKPEPAGRPDMANRLVEFLKRFPQSDADKDGTLTFDEFKAYQQERMSGPAMKERLAETLKKNPEADTDKDGALSPAEVRAFQIKRREMQEKRRAEEDRNPPPFSDVAYGEHEKQRFDVWPVPDAKEPTPLVLFIHGGGFRGGR